MLQSRRQIQPLRWLGVVTLVAAALVVAGSVAAVESQVERVVAIGDIHGEYDGLIAILRASGLVDAEGRWSGGRATLVQTGDLTDRGAHVRQVLDLLMRLEQQAAEQGGRVIVLMGNHEMTNLLGDFQDVTEEIFASFAADDSDRVREKAWKEWVRWMRQLARSRGAQSPEFSKEVKAQWVKEHPLGYFEYQGAMSPEGKYGQWLIERPVMVRIGNIAYMHAGISPEYADQSIDAINALHRREIEKFNENRAVMVKKGIIPSFFNLYEINQALVFQSTNPPVEQFLDPAQNRLIVQAAEDLNRLQEILLENSPLWYRGFTTLSEEELLQHLDRLEQTHGVHRFVVAHSPMATGEIRERLGGRVFLIDTGMLASYYAGRPSALEVAEGAISALYVDDKRVLVETAKEIAPAAAASDSPLSRRQSTAAPAVLRVTTLGRVRAAAYPPATAAAVELPERVWLDPDGNRLPFRTPEEVQDFLRIAKVVSTENIPKGVTKPKKILLEANGVRAHAKFNYVDRQGQREKLADGTVEMYFLDSFKADMAAYELSRLLGMDNVPPAVIRDIDGQDGIVQLWIEGLTTYESWLQQGNTGTPPSLYLERQVKDMRVFDLLIRNTDRNQGNIVWDQDNNLWLIDHTRSMARANNLRAPETFKGCSRRMFEVIKSLDPAAVEASLRPYLGTFEIKALFKRREKLLKLMESEIRKKGEDEILFDYGDPPKGMVIEYDDASA